MWTKPSNNIDIYTFKYDETEGKFTVGCLKSFPSPRGAFILVESNFTYVAPTK